MKKKNNKKNKKVSLRDQIENLESRKAYLEKDINYTNKENKKNLRIRNLRVFASTCNLLAPFVISAALSVGGFRLCREGYPFYKDDIRMYKNYELKYDTDGEIDISESYVSNVWYELSGHEVDNIEICTPYNLEDNVYVRYKRKYEIDDDKKVELYNAVIDNNFEYIEEVLKDYKEEKETITNIDDIHNKYHIKANMSILDTDDVLKYKETTTRNIIVTILELFLTLGLGAIITRNRKFDYKSSIKEISSECKLGDTAKSEQELEKINKKLLVLQRRGMSVKR